MKTKQLLFENRWLRSPRLEICIMIASVILAYFGLAILGAIPEEAVVGRMATSTVAWIQFAFFMLSVAIAMISVIAGIGGGVIFSPIMLAFTPVNSLVVRGAGLIVAMFSGLISTGIFIKKGLSSYKLALVMTLSQALGALLGATLAVSTSAGGNLTEGFLRTSLGLILFAIAVYFFRGGSKLLQPKVDKVDGFTARLGLDGEYFEESQGEVYSYRVKRAPLGIILIFVVGLIGGFFGMGGGWAITPVLNLGMGIPLKLAAANSGVILGIGSCVSIWPYVYAGAVIPLFVLPWLSGQVIGGFMGSYALARIKVDTVRIILIGIMAFTSFGLITKGLSILGFIVNPSSTVQVIVFTLIICAVIVVIYMNKRKEQNTEETKVKTIEGPQEAPEIHLPLSNRVYAGIVHWITLISSILALFVPIFILINARNNVLDPNLIFSSIFDGATPTEIWTLADNGVFPGAHYYLQNLAKADSWAQIAITLGCSVGLWALIPTVAIQLFKEKSIKWGLASLALLVLIALPMLGII